MGEFSKKNLAPTVDASSSVFLSPPLSNEFLLPSKSVSKIALNQHVGIPTFSLNDEEQDGKVDILEELLKRALVPMIGVKIFDYLSDKELLRVSHVSSAWRLIIQLHLKSGRRLRRYVKRKKILAVTTKENQDQGCKFKAPPHGLISTGTPLQQLNEQAKYQKTEISEAGLSTPIINRDSKSSYRHCPQCHSPSRTIFKQIGHCTNCGQDFCLHCFYTNSKHSPTCVAIGGSGVSGSPRKLDESSSSSRRYSMNSRESKARLKRL